MVERNLAKVEVAGSNLVIRSKLDEAASHPGSGFRRLLPLLSPRPPFILRPRLLPSPTLAAYLLLAAGIALWSINLVHNRDLFLDEANVVRNLFDRSYLELFRPLDYQQYAPPLYLVWTKALAEALGYYEWVLRLPAFCGGLLGALALWRGSRLLLTGYWRLLPLALLFANPTVLRYVTEVKPYGLDMGLAALLLYLHLRPRARDLGGWLAIGVLVPWLSLPSVFVLATIGLRGLATDRRWLGVVAAWLASFGLLYAMVLAPSVGSGYLNDFHRDYFIPLSADADALRQTGRILLRLLRLSIGFTLLALFWGAGTQVVAALHRSEKWWLLWPLALVAAASTLQLYSLLDRLVLFVLPGVWWFTALGAQEAARLLRKRGKWPLGVYVLITVIAVGGTTPWRYAWAPVRTSDARRLAAYPTGPDIYVDDSAVPVVDYYRRIRSGGGSTMVPEVSMDYPRDRSYTVLFDVTTARSTHARVEKIAAQARKQSPQCEVKIEELFRARVVQVRCPGRNSDP